MKKLLALFAIAALLCVSCGKEYDDSALNNRVDNLENRVARLEELCKQMNTNISSLQTIVKALQTNDCITGVTPVTSGGTTIGYTITFSQSAPITIYHGQNGKDGKDGTDGKDGKDGHTPMIGVRQDTDGIYYWTLDGEWLLDTAGNKIKAEGRDGEDGKDGADGKDGKDGITPQLKIENDYWYVSTNNGATWINLGKATSENNKDGDSIFKSVTQDNNNVYFTLVNGEVITIPIKTNLKITFAGGTNQTFDIDEVKDIRYFISGGSRNNVINAEMLNDDGQYSLQIYSESVDIGTIKVSTKVPTPNRIIVYVSDGENTIITAIDVNIKPSFNNNTITIDTPGTLESVIADYDKTTITELTIIGTLNSQDTRALRSLPNLAVLDVENVYLIDGFSFMQYAEALTSIKLPRTLKIIDDQAFTGCSNLKSMSLHDGITSIGTGAFWSCTSLSSINIPNSVNTINQNAFYGCESLTNIDIPNGIRIIEKSTFRGCKSWTNIFIPDSVISIEEYAFFDCQNVSKITIGSSVKEIANLAFGHITPTSVYCKALTPPILSEHIFISKASTLYVPIGSKSAYQKAIYWNDMAKEIIEMEF